MNILHYKPLLSTIGGLAMLFSTGTAYSASTATALIDWSTFTITAINLGSGLPTYTLSDESSAVYSLAETDSAYDWTSSIVANSADGLASADEDSINATSTNGSFAWAEREGIFTISGSGLLLFQADYALSVATDTINDYASAHIEFFAETESDTGFEYYFSISDLYTENNLVSSLEKNKTLSLAFVVNDGDIVRFGASANAYTSSPVPVPAAVWFFSSALIGLIGFNNRKNNA